VSGAHAIAPMPHATRATSVAESLIDALRAHGATEVFGIPGDFALPFFDALERSGKLPLHTLSHEPSTAFAADASARIRGGLGVVAATYGAGALNLVNAVAAAYAEKSPLVVVSGAPGTRERSSGLLLHHQARTLDSQSLIYREITCAQARLDDPARAPEQIARVLAAAREVSRPVYIEIPRDVSDLPCGPVQAAVPRAGDGAAIAECARQVAARLAAAARPVLMVGVEVRRFGLESRVAALARRLGLPVVTSFMGRGLLAGTDAPLAGTYLGAAGDARVTELVEGSDALLMLGVIVCDTNFGVSARRVDLARAMHAFDGRVALGSEAHASIPLGKLVEELLRIAPARAVMRPAEREAPPRGLVADATPLAPIDIATGLNDLMRRHGPFPVAADVGDSLFVAMDLVPTDYVAPGYYAGMGFGVPAALGLQAATSRRPIAIVGDGAFQMTGLELGHCRRHGWDPIVVVLDNGGWGMISAFRPHARYADLGEWDFASIARSLGGRGTRVATRAELARALEEAARERGRFHLIHAKVAPGALSERMQRFAGAVSRR
jgi:indolepyruvate decarboxylase